MLKSRKTPQQASNQFFPGEAPTPSQPPAPRLTHFRAIILTAAVLCVAGGIFVLRPSSPAAGGDLRVNGDDALVQLGLSDVFVENGLPSASLRPLSPLTVAPDNIVGDLDPEEPPAPEDKEDEEDVVTVGEDSIGGTYDGKVMKLQKQVELPPRPVYQRLNVEHNFSPVFGILKRKGWVQGTTAPHGKVNMFFSRGALPTSRMIEGKQIINSIGVSGCIGGNKQLQYQCRKKFADFHGCSLESLAIQPRQFFLGEPADCTEFYQYAALPENKDRFWMVKQTFSYHGAGIKIYSDWTAIKRRFGKCKELNGAHFVVSEYVDEPATIKGGYKFDIRTYLLVGSLKPKIVFFHEGFARKSDTIYDKHAKSRKVHITNLESQSQEDHFLSFDELAKELVKEMHFPSDYMVRAIEYMKRVTLFLFETTKTQLKPLNHKAGRWHLFGIDWLVGADGSIHLLEGNGYPLVTDYKDIDLTPKIWEDMTNLVLTLQTDPDSLGEKLTVEHEYKYEGWEMVYNELEDIRNANLGYQYSPCKVFNHENTRFWLTMADANN